jgi:hypothetical protein
MNEEIKAQWVAALRSGEYQQGLHALKEETSDGTINYCCLGVLCEIAKGAGIVQEFAREYGGYAFGSTQCGTSMGYLPEIVTLWSGLPDKNPAINGISLASYNDQGSTFTEIADLIERSL